MINESKLIEESLFQFLENLDNQKIKYFNSFFKSFKGEFLSINLLSSLTKQELDNLRKIFKLQGTSNLKKADLAKCIDEYICDNLLYIIKNYLLIEELSLLEDVILNNGVMAAPDDENFARAIKALKSIGLLYPVFYDNTDILVIPKNLIELLKDIVSNSEVIDCIKNRTQKIQSIKLLLEYYGAANYDTISSKLQEAFNITEESLKQDLESYAKRYNDINIKDSFILNGKLSNIHHVIKEQNSKDQLNYFTIDICSAIETDCFTYSFNQWENKLFSYLRELLNTSEEVLYDIATSCIYAIKNDLKLNEILNFLMIKIIFQNEKQLLSLVPYINDIYNNSNLWILKGNSYNKTSNTNTATSNKVGRNSSCPCGSGKKFKKCCGKI
ncbi:SEC-C metal-binding domain-containing protein [Desnuesiella massiliensis]|uniref:SEC-C metal-binding domain-containing protein n=1 Tax=Desnuesiella massiliensis TaxID=1650662 RepID=UPI0006E1887D|nr:SEC-C metal-binding domain-containing protein [Desnuesiella massiliensis]